MDERTRRERVLQRAEQLLPKWETEVFSKLTPREVTDSTATSVEIVPVPGLNGIFVVFSGPDKEGRMSWHLLNASTWYITPPKDLGAQFQFSNIAQETSERMKLDEENVVLLHLFQGIFVRALSEYLIQAGEHVEKMRVFDKIISVAQIPALKQLRVRGE